MKALSIRQPWAWLITSGGKDVENRSWTTTYRGRFLIHAAQGMTRDEYTEAAIFAARRGQELPTPGRLQRGGIIGVAELVDVLPVPRLCELPNGWRVAGQYGFVLRHARPLPFVPCKGALGFWGDFEVRDGAAVRTSEVSP